LDRRWPPDDRPDVACAGVQAIGDIQWSNDPVSRYGSHCPASGALEKTLRLIVFEVRHFPWAEELIGLADAHRDRFAKPRIQSGVEAIACQLD